MMTAVDITKVSVRNALAARREPYWNRLETGLYIGFRKLPTGAGTWIARRRNEDGKQEYRALGTISTYDDAVKQARTWFTARDAGVSRQGVTVREVAEQYVKHLRLHKGTASANDAAGRFRRLVDEAPIGRIDLARLRTSDLKSWLAGLIEVDEDEDDEDDLRRAKDSANRNLASLKAALNLALRDRLVATDAGWRTVVPFKGVGRRRQGFIPHEQRGRLLDHCPDDLALLVRALLLTAARPGEMAKVVANNFDRAQGTLALAGKTGFRVVTLSTAARKFFETLSTDKIASAPLFTTTAGATWTKDAWKKMFRSAVAAAQLPDDIVMYSLRHTAISEMIANGMDSFVVARLAGTSTAMIDKHYGHLKHDVTRARLDAVQIV
ncbi:MULTISPECIES: tyrosine-type recombinase/integrase [Burkholderia]|uniref:tyrosine-type recombinase/integrase n=1 Tax=Burkholderia TaxID=32008 RepID=UPI001FC8CA27|nr:tyrosine-type recombinase/integrase [Burkholderia ambifaria]